MMNSLLKVGHHDGDVHQDLLLAAEIGKSLLERNRELETLLKSTQERNREVESLLKTTQDYADEQTQQVDYYMKQVEILRESNDSYNQSFEQLESNNKQLYDKYEQQQTENKILQGKNNRLWEIINNLEKQKEGLRLELEKVETELNDIQNETIDSKNETNDSAIYLDEKPSKFEIQNEENLKNNELCSCRERIDFDELELQNEAVHKQASELKVMLKVEKLQREEIEAQLDDVINENQLLHHKIANLHQEISEWEKFAEKEENYRRLAEAFTAKHHLEIETDEQTLTTTLNEHSNMSPNTRNELLKAKSCEFLHELNKDGVVLKTPNLVNNVLSAENSSSFLSELDSEYADLVKRYEALLEKCKQEGRLIENPERTKKVQRAIQTLSFDFSKLVSPTPSPNEPQVKFESKNNSVQVTHNSIGTTVETNTAKIEDGDTDYRVMFAEIFAIIKQKDSVDSDT